MKSRPHFCHLSALWMPCLVLASLVNLAGESSAQVSYAWRSESTNGNWSDANNWWRGFTETPAGSETLNFDNGVQSVMTNNLSATNRFRINFFLGSSARTINGSTANTFFDFGGAVPAIYNNSGQTQTINFKIINGNSNGATRLELNADSSVNSGSNLVFGGDVSASGGSRVLAVMGSGNTSISGKVMQESGATLSLSKEGSGTLTLTNADNSFTGSTSISGGTIQVSGSGALTGTNSLSISGGTLLMNGTAGDRINNAATVALGGGSQTTIRVGGAVTETLGALTLASGAGARVIDFGSTSSVLTFSSLSSAAAAIPLQIWNWTAGGANQLTISAGSLGSNTALSDITFYSGSGTGSLGIATFSGNNLVPVPEPGALLATLALLAPLAWRERRHWVRCREARVA